VGKKIFDLLLNIGGSTYYRGNKLGIEGRSMKVNLLLWMMTDVFNTIVEKKYQFLWKKSTYTVIKIG
jgi:hypothetical protein